MYDNLFLSKEKQKEKTLKLCCHLKKKKKKQYELCIKKLWCFSENGFGCLIYWRTNRNYSRSSKNMAFWIFVYLLNEWLISSRFDLFSSSLQSFLKKKYLKTDNREVAAVLISRYKVNKRKIPRSSYRHEKYIYWVLRLFQFITCPKHELAKLEFLLLRVGFCRFNSSNYSKQGWVGSALPNPPLMAHGIIFVVEIIGFLFIGFSGFT